MQSNDILRPSSTSHLIPQDLQSQLNMIYALTQQQQQISSPSDSKIKRFKYVILV